MKNTFDHNLIASFLLWFDNRLLTKGEAFTNHSSLLYSMEDERLQSYSIYGSPFKQWVSDYSVPNAQIPSGLWSTGTFIPRGQSGLTIDYYNGRALFSGGTSVAPLSGQYAIKDFNIYYTNEQEEKLLFDTKFVLRPNNIQELSGLKANEKTFPSVFIKYYEGKNTPLAFGGMDNTNAEFRAIVLTNSSYHFEGICSIFRDSSKTVFGLLNESELPYNHLGDFKSGDFNYKTVANAKTGTDLMFIEDVFVSKFSERINSDINPKILGAVIDFSIPVARYPRTE